MLRELFNENTFWTIAIGTSLLGATSGIFGSFAVLKKQSLLGDAVSHAALPGIVLAFLLSGEKSTYILLIGAIICGIFGVYFINDIIKNSKLKTDTALGIILSVFFGIGMMLLTYIQKLPNSNQSGLERYLFGQAATLMPKDIYIMLGFLIPALILVVLLWKEFKLMLFDVEYAKTLGIPTERLNILMMLLVVIIIVMGLQTVGVVLMSSLLLAPAAGARQWTNSLSRMLLIASIFGAFSGFTGSLISATQNNLPTGPVIVLIISSIVIFSMLFAPKRGIIATYFSNKEKQKEISK